MSHKEDFEKKIEAIKAIPDKEVATPNMPMETYHKEAEYLEKWCQKDKAKLVAAGLDWSLVEDLPYRNGASRETQANWAYKRFQRKEAQDKWAKESPAAYDLRDSVVHSMSYAYRKLPDLLAKVRAVAEGDGDADMLQDLNVLHIIGRENLGPLEAIGFDMSLIDKLARTGETMASLRASASVDSDEVEELKVLRDKAYTHLKEAVDEIRQCGQYVFWRDESRRAGYASEYLRRNRKSAETAKADKAKSESQA
jgi:hypothetical protein